MKVIVSLTSTPPRLHNLHDVLSCLTKQMCHEIWLNIPTRYSRWPEWDGVVPDYNMGTKVVINRNCVDMGPGTKYLGVCDFLERDDIIVYVDDDTIYDQFIVKNLLKWWKTDPNCAWGLSGFNKDDYFRDYFPRNHGVDVDVIEGYGSVLVKAGWIQDLKRDFELEHDAKFADDIIISKLLQKNNIKCKTVCVQECNLNHVKQLTYGFKPDALHNQTIGGHKANYSRILNGSQ